MSTPHPAPTRSPVNPVLQRLQLDVDKAHARATAAKSHVQSAKAALKKARKLSKLAKKAAKQAKKRMAAARAADKSAAAKVVRAGALAARPPKASRPGKHVKRVKAARPAQPAASVRSSGSKPLAKSRQSAGEVARSVIKSLAAAKPAKDGVDHKSADASRIGPASETVGPTG